MTNEIVALQLGFLAIMPTTWAQATCHTAILIHGRITGLGETLVKDLQRAHTLELH